MFTCLACVCVCVERSLIKPARRMNEWIPSLCLCAWTASHKPFCASLFVYNNFHLSCSGVRARPCCMLLAALRSHNAPQFHLSKRKTMTTAGDEDDE